MKDFSKAECWRVRKMLEKQIEEGKVPSWLVERIKFAKRLMTAWAK
jgi:hypothetical protein